MSFAARSQHVETYCIPRADRLDLGEPRRESPRHRLHEFEHSQRHSARDFAACIHPVFRCGFDEGRSE